MLKKLLPVDPEIKQDVPALNVSTINRTSLLVAVAAARAAAVLVPSMAELLLSRKDTSKTGAQVLFGKGGGKPDKHRAAAAAASLFVLAVGHDDPAGAAVGAAVGGTGVRTMALDSCVLIASCNEKMVDNDCK